MAFDVFCYMLDIMYMFVRNKYNTRYWSTKYVVDGNVSVKKFKNAIFFISTVNQSPISVMKVINPMIYINSYLILFLFLFVNQEM